MIIRSDCESLPKPTLSPCTRVPFSVSVFSTAAVWCVPALRVPLVHSLISHFRQKERGQGRFLVGHTDEESGAVRTSRRDF